MSAVELTPTLRAHLDALDPYLDDPSVLEILVAGPDRVFVTRGGRSTPVDLEIGEARLRSLADRLLRAMGSRGRPERQEVQTGRIAEDLEVTVIGAPRGARCPLVRVIRRRSASRTLDEILGGEQLTGEAESILRDTPRARSAVLFSGPHGAPRLDLVVALASAWRDHGRVLILDAEDGPLARSGAGDLVLEPNVGVDAMRAVAPDVVVALDPPPNTWADLFAVGRPLVVSVEAPDGQIALSRVMALVLAGSAELSRSAAEALVEAGIGIVVELSATPGEPSIGRVGRPAFSGERLVFSALTRAESRIAPAITANLASPVGAILSRPPPADIPRTEEPFVDPFAGEHPELLPEDLVSKSFVHEIGDGLVLVESTKDIPVVTEDVDATATGDGLAFDDVAITRDGPADLAKPIFDVEDSRLSTDEEDATQFAADADHRLAVERTAFDPDRSLQEGEVMDAFAEAVEAVEELEADDDPEPYDEVATDDRLAPAPKGAEQRRSSRPRSRRVPNERTPTVVGQPGDDEEEDWAAEAFEAAADVPDVVIPEDDDADLSSPFERFDDQDLRTATGMVAPSLDPFDADPELVNPVTLDPTDAAERTLGVHNMVRPPKVDDVYDARVVRRRPSKGAPRGASLADDVSDSRISRRVPAEEMDDRLTPVAVQGVDDAGWDEEGPSLIIDGPPELARRRSIPDADETRAGEFTVEEEMDRARRTKGRAGPNLDSASEDERRPVRRRPPGRSLD